MEATIDLDWLRVDGLKLYTIYLWISRNKLIGLIKINHNKHEWHLEILQINKISKMVDHLNLMQPKNYFTFLLDNIFIFTDNKSAK